ncbi:MAG: hypothetical protein J7K34_01055 [Flavobacteriaceae bacterium]|nr:hypothetical protein [Flavobacteriaceae bacterium]
MGALQIKLNLIKQITQIEDAKLLEKLQTFLNTSGSLDHKNISLQNNEESEFTDTEDFTDYIKEWVKDME